MLSHKSKGKKDCRTERKTRDLKSRVKWWIIRAERVFERKRGKEKKVGKKEKSNKEGNLAGAGKHEKSTRQE